MAIDPHPLERVREWDLGEGGRITRKKSSRGSREKEESAENMKK